MIINKFSTCQAIEFSRSMILKPYFGFLPLHIHRPQPLQGPPYQLIAWAALR